MRIVKGDTNVIDVSVVRQEAAVDLTAAKAWFTVKVNQTDDDDDAVLALNSEDEPSKVAILDPPTTGHIQVILQPEDTEDLLQSAYYFDIQVKEASTIVTTVANGVLHIVQDVTRAIL